MIRGKKEESERSLPSHDYYHVEDEPVFVDSHGKLLSQ